MLEQETTRFILAVCISFTGAGFHIVSGMMPFISDAQHQYAGMVLAYFIFALTVLLLSCRKIKASRLSGPLLRCSFSSYAWTRTGRRFSAIAEWGHLSLDA